MLRPLNPARFALTTLVLPVICKISFPPDPTSFALAVPSVKAAEVYTNVSMPLFPIILTLLS